MNVVKPSLKKYTLLRTDLTDKFRNADNRISRVKNNLVFLHNSLANPFVLYHMITAPLVDGVYDFMIKAVDDLNNINTGVSKTGTITEKLWYPKNLTVTDVTGNNVTLKWSAPVGGSTPSNFVVYGNGGTGYVIDRLTPLATVSGTTYTATFTVTDGNWLFVVESTDGVSETENYYTVYQTVPLADIIPTSANVPANPLISPVSEDYPEYQLKNVQLRNVSVGKCEISFIWEYGNLASHFRIYHDSGTGTINWTTYAFRYERQESQFQVFTTDQIMSVDENTLYKFGIRAESPDGVIEENTVEFEVTLDGVAPGEATDVDTEAV